LEEGYVQKRKKKRNIPGIILLILGALSLLNAIFMGAGMDWNPNYVGGYFLYVYMFMVIGIILMVIGIIPVLVTSKKDKKIRMKLDSMSQSDLVNMFDCPGSGNKGAVHLIKLEKDNFLVKQRCPPKGGRSFRIPLTLKDQSIPHFRDTVFRCYKCGQGSTVDHVKSLGWWTLIKLSCPTHGNNLPYHKIWTNIFIEISNEGSPIKFSAESERQIDSISQSDLDNLFTCPGCGSKVATFLIKPENDQILVKQKCPNHLEKVRRIPLMFKDQCVSYFRDSVFRCYECGQEATVEKVRFSPRWTLINLSCPTHGNKLPTHKIWSIVYSDISKGVETTP